MEEGQRERQREKLARIVLDSMYQFVGLLDARGHTLEINRAALEGAGVTLADIEGQPFWQARWFQVSPESIELQRELVGRACKGEFVRCDIEVYGKAAGDETIVVDYSLRPVRDEQGQVVFLLAEGRNITEKKQAEAEIARKNAELHTLLERIRQLDQQRSDFFAHVSHALRTPLALILGCVEDLDRSDSPFSISQRRQLGVVHRNATALLGHVDDLLDVAKLDAQQMDVHMTSVDLVALVREQAEQFHPLALQHDVTYTVLTPDAFPLVTDADKVARVLHKLLSNAFKFTPPGGWVRCGLERTGQGEALLSVQDSGPGVPPDERELIFQRFRPSQQNHPNRPNRPSRQGRAAHPARQPLGTGLGLSIAKELTELLHGVIDVRDAPEGGAFFQVRLPAMPPRETHASSPPAPPSLSSLSIHAGAAQPEERLEKDSEDLAELTRHLSEHRRALQASEHRWWALYEHSPVGIALVHANGVIKAANPAFRWMVGYSNAEICATTLPRLTPVEERAQTQRRIDRLLANEILEYHVQRRFQRKDGTLVWANTSVSLVPSDRYGEKLLVVVAEDMTEQRQAEQALQRSRSELAQVSRVSTLGELTASIAHEVNQPLAAIVANGHAALRWLSAQPPDEGEVKAAIGRIVRDASLAGKVIHRIRGFVRRRETQQELVDVNEVIRSVLDLVRGEAQTRRIEVSLALSAGLPLVRADRVEIQQVILNLAMNAIEAVSASPPSAHTPPKQLHICTQSEGDCVRTDVQDNGAGIDPAIETTLFNAFQTTKPEGMGMGLAISRSIVESHGGRLWFTPRPLPDQGVTFSFQLPHAEHKTEHKELAP